LRVSAANFDLEGATIEQRARELDVLAEVTRRFIGVVVAQERVQFATQESSLAGETVGAIDARVRAGRSPEAERSRARVAQIRASVEFHQAQSDLLSARYAGGCLGQCRPTFDRAKAQLFDLPAVASLAVCRNARSVTDFLRFASLDRQRDAAAAGVRKHVQPHLHSRRAAIRSDKGLSSGSRFSMPLALFTNQAELEAEVRWTRATRSARGARACLSNHRAVSEMSAAQARSGFAR
jgi:cobalt-zinc-cadmium efflux system outer membrane protein